MASARISPVAGSSSTAEAARALVDHRAIELPLDDVLQHHVQGQHHVLRFFLRRADQLLRLAGVGILKDEVDRRITSFSCSSNSRSMPSTPMPSMLAKLTTCTPSLPLG